MTIRTMALVALAGFTVTACEFPQPPAQEGEQTREEKDKAKTRGEDKERGDRASVRGQLQEQLLELRVTLKLLDELGTDGLRVRVEADESKVELSGTVKERATRELASSVVKNMEDVESVKNEIQLGQEPDGVLTELQKELADTSLETRVRMALLQDLGMDAIPIEIAVADGKIILSGTVDKREIATGAAKRAGNVKGVTEVSSRIEVRAAT